jgi:hypothetical protein
MQGFKAFVSGKNMRVASRALEWMRAGRINEMYVAVYGCAEDKTRLA